MTTFKGFEPVFGAAQGQLESPSIHDVLPFLFYLRAKDSDHLLIHLTDFHANTWCANMSTEYLEEKKDDIGIGGTWEDFVNYVRAVFASDNVKIVLKGSPNVMVSEGATSASVLGQKARGTPKLRVKLTKLQGTAASDAMGSISVEMFKVFRSQAACLSSETTRANQLSTAFMQEKVSLLNPKMFLGRADILQDRQDALSFNKKKNRLRPTLSTDDPFLATQSIVPSQFVTPSVFEDLGTQDFKAAGSSDQMDPKAKSAAKSGLGGHRLRAAPIMRRTKRKTAVDSDDDK